MAEDVEAAGLDERWLAPHQAGRRLNVGTTRVGQLVTEGQLRAMQTPLGKLIDAKSVEALQQARQTRKGGRGG